MPEWVEVCAGAPAPRCGTRSAYPDKAAGRQEQRVTLPLSAQRALKEGVVIRKRRGNQIGSPSSCVPAAHSRECAGMNWHTRRAEVVAPYGAGGAGLSVRSKI